MTKVYQAVAQCADALQRIATGETQVFDAQWANNLHRDRISAIVRNQLPSGSGFDNGTEWNEEQSRPDRLVFNTAFHHMDEHGSYDGWSHHCVIVTPSLAYEIEIRVTGRDRKGIKEYIANCYRDALLEPAKDW